MTGEEKRKHRSALRALKNLRGFQCHAKKIPSNQFRVKFFILLVKSWFDGIFATILLGSTHSVVISQFFLHFDIFFVKSKSKFLGKGYNKFWILVCKVIKPNTILMGTENEL